MSIISKFSYTNIICFIVLLGIAITGLMLVPLTKLVPIHWDFSGEPDLFAPGWVSVLLPALIGTVAVLAVAAKKMNVSFEAGRYGIIRAINAVLLLMIILDIMFILLALGHEIEVPKVVSIAVGGLLILVGDALPKSRPNPHSGLNLPHIIGNPDTWRLTHRWTGRLMVLGGAALIVLSLSVLTTKGMVIGIIAASIVPMIIGIAISYLATPNKQA